MTEETKNIKLIKPDETEFYDVNVTNRNWDIVDEQVEALKNPEYEAPEEPAELVSGENLGTALGKLAEAVRLLLTHKVQQATATILGHVKLSDSAAITEKGVYALDAVEKNAAVEGTLANKIGKKQDSLGFVPVQQGGGINQGTNKIYIGWNGALCCTVDNTNIGAFSFVGHTHDYIPTSASCNKNWNWFGQGGQPTWLWGGEDGTNMYVYNPSGFNVNGAHKGLSADKTVYTATTGRGGYFGPWSNKDGSKLNLGMSLGSAANKWTNIYAGSSTIQTSDRNYKKNIKGLTDTHLKFFLLLQPVSFLMKDGTSGRTHVGFIAQDVEQAMTECELTDLDFAGFCKDVKMEERFENDEYVAEPILDKDGKPEYVYSLRYEEFTGLIVYAVQKLWDKVSEIEKKVVNN